MKTIKCFDTQRDNPQDSYDVRIDRYADLCPICKKAQEPRFINAFNVQEGLEVVFKCHNFECGSLFISKYYNSSALYRYHKSFPSGFEKKEVNEEIKEISEKYSDIINEAYQCEHHDLMEVAGMGYRKALEFLVKDYLISIYPDKTEDIKRKMLGACIKTYITSESIKQIAERAAWLGNDEAHYERRWNEKDIEDLKKLIDITQHYISMEIQAKKYISDMPE